MATPKDLHDYLPILKDQGIKNLVGTGKRGISLQLIAGAAMPADGIFVFADYGLEDMAAAGEYGVLVINHTDVADQGKVPVADRLTDKLTVTGPDADDVLDIVIVGRLKGQLA